VKSIWNETTIIPRRNPLPGNRKAEVVVIGAGLAGILTAYYLSRQGKSVIVLEADRIGGGQTGYTTAKITSQHNLIYEKLEKTMGTTLAAQYAKANQWAVEEYKKLVRIHKIDCHLEEKDSYLYSLKVSEVLRREADAAVRLGIPATFEREVELPFHISGAVRFPGQAQFHPLEFIKDMSSGLTIYEKTRVIEVKDHQVITDKGTVTAEHIVFACHYPFAIMPGFYFMKMYQKKSYVMEFAPVEPLSGMYLGIDQRGYSFRSVGDHLLLGYGSHRTGKPKKENPYDVLKRTGKHLYSTAEEVRHWSAMDCMTLDSVPYIGHFSSGKPYWHVATGFKKWGMTSSMVAARIISAEILGRRTEFSEVFSPQRFRLRASAKELASHTVESVKGLSQGRIPGVVTCPHLGCRLTWNRADKRWECPCHGSSFEQNGKILSGPAQRNLPFID
jgi:glycine/D-amino acid oxidase-like deaminating enzyme